MDELKPCPFCGSEADYADVPESIPTCTNKDCKMSFGLKMSGEQWNTRAIEPRLKEAVKEIETWIDELQTRREDKDGSYVCYLDGQIAGLAGALYYLEEHLPELKEGKDGCSMDGDDWEGEDDYGYGEVKDE